MIKVTCEFEAGDMRDLVVDVANVVGLLGTDQCEVTAVHPGDPATATMVRTFSSAAELFEVIGSNMQVEE